MESFHGRSMSCSWVSGGWAAAWRAQGRAIRTGRKMMVLRRTRPIVLLLAAHVRCCQAEGVSAWVIVPMRSRALAKGKGEKFKTDGLLKKLANKGVLAGDEVVKRSIEDEAAIGEHQERSG